MLKAVGTRNGRKTLMIGLSFGNLDLFRAAPGESFIEIKGSDVGLPVDVVIFSGETEEHLANIFMSGTKPAGTG
jgi:hypothetical protein